MENTEGKEHASMTPREIVTRAIEFRRPCRIPIENFGPANDIVLVGTDTLRPPEATDDDRVDEWLCCWEGAHDSDQGQVKTYPLEDLSRLKDFPWPDANDPARYAGVPDTMARVAADPARRDRYAHFGVFMLLWERMQALHGFENCMLDLMDDTLALVRQLAEGPTRVLGYTKAAVYRGSDEATVEAAYEHQGLALHLARQTDDFAEGRTAFLEKRPPRFTGR